MNAISTSHAGFCQLKAHKLLDALALLCYLYELIHNQCEVLLQSITNKIQIYQPCSKILSLNRVFAISTALLRGKFVNNSFYSSLLKEECRILYCILCKYSLFLLFSLPLLTYLMEVL